MYKYHSQSYLSTFFTIKYNYNIFSFIFCLLFLNLFIFFIFFIVNSLIFYILYHLINMIQTSPRTRILIDLDNLLKINIEEYKKIYNEKIILDKRIKKIGRAHVWTPVTGEDRMPASAWKKKKGQIGRAHVWTPVTGYDRMPTCAGTT